MAKLRRLAACTPRSIARSRAHVPEATPGTSPARRDEIDDKPLGRKICGERSCFYRGPRARSPALEDFCPHRGAPLSLGSVRRGQAGLRLPRPGDGLRRQDRRHAGPARARLPDDPRLSRSIERYGFVWVWPGDARAGRPGASCTTCDWAESPEWAYGGGLYHVALRLPADDRQPDGPDARDLRARHQHRPEGDRRDAARRRGPRATR